MPQATSFIQDMFRGPLNSGPLGPANKMSLQDRGIADLAAGGGNVNFFELFQGKSQRGTVKPTGKTLLESSPLGPLDLSDVFQGGVDPQNQGISDLGLNEGLPGFGFSDDGSFTPDTDPTSLFPNAVNIEERRRPNPFGGVNPNKGFIPIDAERSLTQFPTLHQMGTTRFGGVRGSVAGNEVGGGTSPANLAALISLIRLFLGGS